MNSDQLYLTEYFHHLFSLDQKNAVREWVTAFDVYRSAWLWEECSWMLRLVKGLPLEEESQFAVLEQEGLFWFNQHEWKKTESTLHKAHAIAEKLEDYHAVARTLGHLGMVEQANGHLPKALELFQQSDVIFERVSEN